MKILLRDEVKPNEHRAPLSPEDCKKLISKGFTVHVEKSKCRIFADKSYEEVGCTLVENHSWITDASSYDTVVGLKELPLPGQKLTTVSGKEVVTPKELTQRHVMFAHCYKYQDDWKDTMDRFVSGGGELLDLEFLQFDNLRRIAAFGQAAGFAGAAVGLLVWIQQQNGADTNVKLPVYENKNDLIDYVRGSLEKIGKKPKILVLGALGRCGSGSCSMIDAVGITDYAKWDLAETKKGGPFPELLDVDIVVNDIYVQGKLDPFLTKEMIENKTDRSLSVFVDVSCEISDHSPFPFNKTVTTFDKPTYRLIDGDKPVDVVSIDHLPAMIPRESSLEFSNLLMFAMPSLKDINFSAPYTLNENETTEPQRVWQKARKYFQDKVKEYEKVRLAK